MKLEIELFGKTKKDLELIEKHIDIPIKNWMHDIFTRGISSEKFKILYRINSQYNKGKINDNEYKKLTGKLPSKKLKEEKINTKEGARKYIQEIICSLEKK